MAIRANELRSHLRECQYHHHEDRRHCQEDGHKEEHAKGDAKGDSCRRPAFLEEPGQAVPRSARAKDRPHISGENVHHLGKKGAGIRDVHFCQCTLENSQKHTGSPS
jgi:hypothetical protein